MKQLHPPHEGKISSSHKTSGHFAGSRAGASSHDALHISYNTDWEKYQHSSIRDLRVDVSNGHKFRLRAYRRRADMENEGILKEKLAPFSDQYSIMKLLEEEGSLYHRVLAYQHKSLPGVSRSYSGVVEAIGRTRFVRVKDIPVVELFEVRKVA